VFVEDTPLKSIIPSLAGLTTGFFLPVVMYIAIYYGHLNKDRYIPRNIAVLTDQKLFNKKRYIAWNIAVLNVQNLN